MVRCVVGVADSANPSQISVVGHGQAPNLGMRRGIVTHIDDVADAAVRAITEAERLSGIQIAGVTVNINGVHVGGINSKGTIAISNANREITNDDRLRVEEAATVVKLPPNRDIIQVFAKNYRLDGQDNIKDPVGMQGVRLEVDTHIVTAAIPNLRSMDMVLDKARLQAFHKTVSSLAAAETVLNRQQKESGTLVLDIGAGTTNLCVIEDGEVQHVAVLPIGGIHITNDLAIGLKTDLDIAEAVKLQHAVLGDKQKHGQVTLTHEGQKHFFEADGDYGINNIVEARLDDLFDMIDKELKKIHRSRKLPGGVVMAGGTSKLPGIAEYAKERLQLSARVGTMQPLGGLVDTVADTAFSTAIGLMLLDMILIPQNAPPGQPPAGAFGLVTGLLGRFKR